MFVSQAHSFRQQARLAVTLAWVGGYTNLVTLLASGTVRTTHVTGVLTDLGHDLVQFLWWLYDRRRDVPPGSARALIHSAYTHPTARRVMLLASIFGTFVIGAGLGALAYTDAPRLA